MELKLVSLMRREKEKFRSNRTFMELKSDELPPANRSRHRSNRTFMELKFLSAR